MKMIQHYIHIFQRKKLNKVTKQPTIIYEQITFTVYTVLHSGMCARTAIELANTQLL